MAKSLTSLSVFFPAYNDEKTIGKLVEDAFDILPKIANNFEVIVVNDGSSDKTSDVLKNLSKIFAVNAICVIGAAISIFI